MRLIKFYLIFVTFLILNCEALFHEVVIWNVEKIDSFEFKVYSLIGDNIKYTISHEGKVILEYIDTSFFAKWVTKDSILVVTSNPPTKKKLNRTNLNVGIDSLRYCPDSLRYTLANLTNHNK